MKHCDISTVDSMTRMAAKGLRGSWSIWHGDTRQRDEAHLGGQGRMAQDFITLLKTAHSLTRLNCLSNCSFLDSTFNVFRPWLTVELKPWKVKPRIRGPSVPSKITRPLLWWCVALACYWVLSFIRHRGLPSCAPSTFGFMYDEAVHCVFSICLVTASQPGPLDPVLVRQVLSPQISHNSLL